MTNFPINPEPPFANGQFARGARTELQALGTALSPRVHRPEPGPEPTAKPTPPVDTLQPVPESNGHKLRRLMHESAVRWARLIKPRPRLRDPMLARATFEEREAVISQADALYYKVIDKLDTALAVRKDAVRRGKLALRQGEGTRMNQVRDWAACIADCDAQIAAFDNVRAQIEPLSAQLSDLEKVPTKQDVAQALHTLREATRNLK